MMPVDLTTVGRKGRELRVNTGSIIDFANLAAVLGSFLTIYQSRRSIRHRPIERALVLAALCGDQGIICDACRTSICLKSHLAL